MQTFDKSRPEFQPYGLSCVHWMPTQMPRPDRHNEIEINYFPKGQLTFLIKDRKIEVSDNQFLIFWALVPHQIIDVKDTTPYFVCTIPFKEFTEWNISPKVKDCLLNENIILADSNPGQELQEVIFKQWVNDLSGSDKEIERCVILEIQAKLSRIIAENDQSIYVNIGKQSSISFSLVEKIALFIAKNYTKDINVNEIGRALDLHPDYANHVFKKAFSVTIKQYLTEQRITHAQRLLSTTDKKIIEIALESGFNSLSRFNAAFKMLCGCTPKEYKVRLS